MTGIVAGPYALACTLLVVAGASKLVKSRVWLQRALGAGEIVLGATALFVEALAPVVALSYAVFVVVTMRAMLKQKSCGCFGGEERPPTATHVALDAALAVSSAAAVLGDAAPVAYVGFTYLLLLGASTYLAKAVME